MYSCAKKISETVNVEQLGHLSPYVVLKKVYTFNDRSRHRFTFPVGQFVFI